MRASGSVRIGRRAWLAGLGASGIMGLAAGPARGSRAAGADLEAIEAKGAEAGLGPFRSAESRSYRVVGDAPEGFLRLTLRDCEAVAVDYFDHYRSQGFDLKRPAGRLTAVALADARSYAAFLGGQPDRSNGGRYERASNRLYVYDFRPQGANGTLRAGHVNLIFLAHEATHQLAFNTGLLERLGDVPRSISEGIALYGEIRKPDVSSPPGQVNAMRLTDLARKQRQGVAWIPLPRLLADDRPFSEPAQLELTLLAYAQSWLLVYHLMKDPALLPRFRDYLRAIAPRRDPKDRLEDAAAHLGDLDRLDRDLRKLSVRLLKST